MPKCNSCGKNYDDPDALELIRRQDNRWVSVCRSCLNERVDVNLVEPGNIAVAHKPDEHWCPRMQPATACRDCWSSPSRLQKAN